MTSSVHPVLHGRVQGNDLLTSTRRREEEDIDGGIWSDSRPDNRSNCVRIAFWNCGGFPLKNEDEKNREIYNWIRHYQLDAVGFSESNVHWKKLPSAQCLPERTFGWFEQRHICSAYLSSWEPESPYQVGGVSLWTINKMAHRIIKSGSDLSSMGRWCWTTYRGRQGQVLRIISAYRCVENMSGSLSVWSQQRAFLLTKASNKDPRDAFVDDIIADISRWLEAGDHIILGLDLNEDIRVAPLTTRLSELGMINLLCNHYEKFPPTYIRGTAPIDGIYVSAQLQGSFCGYLPFFGDHRPAWLDVPEDLVFPKMHVPSPRARRLKLQDPRIVHKYTTHLQAHVEQHNLVHRAIRLSERRDFHSLSFSTEYNAIDLLRIQGMSAAEKQCRKLRMGATPYSPEYSQLSKKVLVWSLIVKVKRGGSVDSRYLRRQVRQANLPSDSVQVNSLADAQSQLLSAKSALRAYTSTASSFRTHWLEDLAKARAETYDTDAETEIRALLHREQQRKNARMIRYTISSSTSKGLSLVQKQTDTGLIEVSDKDDIEIMLCSELAKRFHQASSTPFSSAPLLHLLGPYGTSAAASQILLGTFNCPPEVDMWTRKLISHLKYVPEANKMQAEFSLHLSPVEHADGWKKMKEFTSPGYSSMSFAQFKAAANVDTLCRLDAMMAAIPYYSGLSPDRWQHGIDVMLQKQEGNFLVEKLRAILLYEADFNQNNKRLGRQAMYLAEKYKTIAVEQFGSRKNMAAIDQSLNKALTFDLWRQLRIPGAICSSDLLSCYDRIVHSFASICLQRMGVPQEPIVSMFSTIQSLHHHIRTVHGTSSRSFSGKDWAIPIHGVGQGNGAGPQVWAILSTPLFDMVRSEGGGSIFVSSLSQRSLQFVGFAFVDDTDLVVSNCNNLSGTTVFNTMQQALSAWYGGITASGGAIVPAKSHWYFVDFIWNQGVPKYKSVALSPGQLQVHDASGQLCTIRQLKPSDAERTLGVRLAPDGNMKAQVKHMRAVAALWSQKINSGNLSRSLTLQALLSTILKTLEYPLPATTLSESQCDYIMAPVLQACLPRLGIVRTMSHKVVYASKAHFGLQIPNLFWLQGYAHIDRLLRYHQSQHLTGGLLQQSMEVLRLELGCNGPLMEIPYDIFGHLATQSWLQHTWSFVQQFKIQLDIDVPEIKLARVHDSLLIPLFASLGFNGVKLFQLNKCRIFLKVALLSEICTGDGQYITYSSWHGIPDRTRITQYRWPNQAPLPYQYWVTWKEALLKLSSSSRKLNRVLGPWTSASSVLFHYDLPSDRVYYKDNSGTFFYPRIPGRPSRQAIARFGSKQVAISLPNTARPATVEFHRSYLYLTGWAEVEDSVEPEYNEFWQFLSSATPNSAKWALQCFRFVGDRSLFVQQCTTTFLYMIAVSDGSYKENHGTASWRISISGSDDYLLCSAVSPGPPECQSAYRSELTGIYGILLTIWQCQQFFHFECSLEIGCDGLSAIEVSKEAGDSINPNRQHFDLISAIRKLVGQIQGQITWRHIKGHQDTVTNDLDMWAQYNIQMDKEAKQFWAETCDISNEERPTRVYGEVGAVSLNGKKIVVLLKQQLMKYLGSLEIIPYWESRFHWSEGTGQNINWEMLGHAISTVPRSRHHWVVKSASGFCAVGKMKVLWKQSTSDQCPRCATSMEDMSHVVRCTQPEATAVWSKRLSELKTWMISSHYVSPMLAGVIHDRLNAWRQNTPVSLESVQLNPSFSRLIALQDLLGWESFLYGFWDNNWESVQGAYLRSLQCKMSIRRWCSALILKLWDTAWDLWDHRNQWLHNSETGEMIRSLHSDISSQYRLGVQGLARAERLLFRRSLQEILNSSVAHKQLWLQRILIARQRSVDRVQTGTTLYSDERYRLRQWLRPST